MALTPVTQSPASNADTGMYPVGLAFSPSGGLLATSDVEGNETAMFGVSDATGALAPLGQTPAGGAFPWGLAFSPSGGLLAEANSTYTQTRETPTLGSVSTFLVNQQTGALTLASTAGAGQQPQGVTFTPNGLFLATANVYSDSVSVYQVDDTTGALSPVAQHPVTSADTGTYPWSPAFSPSGGLLAVANDGSGTVSMFTFNDTTGALTPVTQSLASNAATGTGPWGVAFSPNGGLLAVANTGSDDISIFQVDQTTGQLTPVTQTPATNAATGGSNAVAFSGSGSLLATANTAGSVSLFQVNGTTGALTPVANVSTGTNSNPDAVAFSPCGGLVAAADERTSTVSMFAVSGNTSATLLPGCTSATSGGAGGSGGSGGTGSTGPTGPPVETEAPKIGGSAQARKTLTCSTGSWTNDPTGFTYQWSRDGTPIHAATNPTYTVQTSDEELTLTCTVTASNSKGTGARATSQGVLVSVPKVKNCPAATGKLSGTTLGLAKLGDTRKQAQKAYTRSSNRGKRYEEFFCLTPIGVRVGYGSPALLTTLPKHERASLSDRVIWASTASAYYSVDGVRVGATTTAAGKTLKLTGPIKIGLNDWYFAPEGTGTAVLKVRGGLIEEIGIGDKALTKGAKAERTFLKSFS